MTFDLTCVHIIFSSVSVAEWPTFLCTLFNFYYLVQDKVNSRSKR